MGNHIYRIVDNGFLADSGKLSRFLRVAGTIGANDWTAKQRNSEREYLEGLTAIPKDVQIAYRMFDMYLAAAAYVRSPSRVLDVGCGINPHRPPYTATLCGRLAGREVVYVGLDPMEQNVERRDYPFVCGRIEDTIGLFVDRFDMFVFATTLDHVEDIKVAAQAVRHLASESAICVFWVGVHDPPRIAEAAGASWFRELFASVGLLHLLRALAVLSIRILRLGLKLMLREKFLSRGMPLDDLHFHYFTNKNLRGSLEVFGTLLDLTPVPGTNSVFAIVQVHREP